MTGDGDIVRELWECSRPVADAFDADILLYAGSIQRPEDDRVISLTRQYARRKNVLLILTTGGGSPDAAYRIARSLQRRYEVFVVLVDGRCKSAGTLLAIGANALILSDSGELGPIDTQVNKPDEIGEMTSGLAPTQALTVLQERAFSMFEQSFLRLRGRSGYSITTKMATDLASTMVVGLFSPIYSQIDPMRLGENDRYIRIAVEYANRLSRGNLKSDALAKLVADYPSHGFVIDREESQKLFERVFPPTQDQLNLLDRVRPMMSNPDAEPAFVYFIEAPIPPPSTSDQQEVRDGSASGLDDPSNDASGSTQEGQRSEHGQPSGENREASDGGSVVQPSRPAEPNVSSPAAPTGGESSVCEGAASRAIGDQATS